MPVGASQQVQELVRVTIISPDDYRQEGLGTVRFVPLIGAQEWVGRAKAVGTAETQPY
jgi:protein-L-isoaspartate(D-aspartate) O-methyltransferase